MKPSTGGAAWDDPSAGAFEASGDGALGSWGIEIDCGIDGVAGFGSEVGTGSMTSPNPGTLSGMLAPL